MKAALMALVMLFLAVGGVGAAQLPSAVVTDGVSLQLHAYPSDSQRDRIQAAGVKYIRDDLLWDVVETTQGSYNWAGASSAPYNQFVSDGAARGIHMLYTLLDGGQNLYGGMDPTSAAWRQAFTNYAAAAAGHFAGTGTIFELWNEPENAGISDPSNYMALANQVIPAMRAADPNCTILAPAGASNSFLTTCYQQGLLNLVDAVSVHPYQSGSPEAVVSTYTGIRSLMQTYGGKTLPIVSSESGYSTGAGGSSYVSTPQLQGDYLARTFLVNFSQHIPLSNWYEWDDDPGADAYDGNFGIGGLTNNVATPAYQELQLLTKSLNGETFTSKLNDGHTSDWLLVFTSPGGHQTLAAWTTRSGGRTVTVSGWGTLQLTSTPFYVNPSTIPEPGTFVLLAAGAIASLGYVWRMRRRLKCG